MTPGRTGTPTGAPDDATPQPDRRHRQQARTDRTTDRRATSNGATFRENLSGKINGGKHILNALTIHYGDRITANNR